MAITSQYIGQTIDTITVSGLEEREMESIHGGSLDVFQTLRVMRSCILLLAETSVRYSERRSPVPSLENSWTSGMNLA